MTQMTNHYVDRAKSRKNLNKREAKKHIEIVLKNGMPADAFDCRRANYLKKREKNGCHVLVYHNFVYVFNGGNICVTLVPLPEWFMRKDIRTECGYVRNYYKYYKYNLECKYDYIS